MLGFFLFFITSNDILVTLLSASFHHICILKITGVLYLKIPRFSGNKNGFLSPLIITFSVLGNVQNDFQECHHKTLLILLFYGLLNLIMPILICHVWTYDDPILIIMCQHSVLAENCPNDPTSISIKT